MSSDKSAQKKRAGYRAAEYVEDGMVVGLGTGSTAKYAIEKIGQRIEEENLNIEAIPTSLKTEKRAENANIPLTQLDSANKIDLTIDGADEVDPQSKLIKGGGGALLREKIIASNSKKNIIIVDKSKMVDILGKSFDLPVEILSYGYKAIKEKIETLDCTATLRTKDQEIWETDNGNYIVDCSFPKIDDPESLSKDLNIIPGVVENGLFLDLADKIIIGKEKGFEERD